MKKHILLLALSIIISTEIQYAQANFSLVGSICKSDTDSITANTGSMTNCTFTWVCNPAGGNFSAPGNSITNLSFSSAGTFSIILTISSGTVVSSMQNTINALALPTITLSQTSFTTCITNNSPAFSKPVSLAANGGISYTWNPAINPIAGNPNGPSNTVRPVSNACFSVTGIDNNGCKAMASVCVTVIPRFTVNVTPVNTLICQNGLSGPDQVAVLIVNNPTPPAYGSTSSHTYSWTGTDILTPPLAATISVAPFTTTTYTAEIRDSLNCLSIPALAMVSVQNCTGLSERNSIELDVNIFPNPVADKLNIKTSDSRGISEIIIINAIGVTLMKITLPKGEIDVSGLPAGMYLLQIRSAKASKTTRIIKN